MTSEQQDSSKDASNQANADQEHEDFPVYTGNFTPVRNCTRDDPGQSATVLVALAIVGATPVKSRAGTVKNVPPPATELLVLPIAVIRNKISKCKKVIRSLSLQEIASYLLAADSVAIANYEHTLIAACACAHPRNIIVMGMSACGELSSHPL